MFKNILSNKIGINKTIYYTLLTRIIQGFAGFVNLILITKSLNTIEQGYYYTFSSILAIQVFFELGLSTILIQYFAHESVNLNFTNPFNIVGPEYSKSRLSSLFRFSLKWYGIISFIFIFIVIISGIIFFKKFGTTGYDINWKKPWILLSISTAISLFVSPILAFFEGIGKIKEVAKIRLLQTFIQVSSIIIFFLIGLKLYSSPLASLLALLIIFIWILKPDKFMILKNIWKNYTFHNISYLKEIFPFQWKIAISWISGYFIFQLFNPVIFATEGAKSAGQMGMTIVVLNTALMISLTWINTKVSTFSSLVATKNYNKLDEIFNKSILQSSIVNAIILIFLISGILFLRHYQIIILGKNIEERFLPNFSLLMMSFSIFFNHISSSLATYLRSHKKEPLVLQSIIVAILCTLSTFGLGNRFGVQGITTGFSIISLFALFWIIYIFLKKKREWHNE
jgi:O-antigen/teichoic acid export membrane protein